MHTQECVNITKLYIQILYLMPTRFFYQLKFGKFDLNAISKMSFSTQFKRWLTRCKLMIIFIIIRRVKNNNTIMV